jgi:hypothetical protein
MLDNQTAARVFQLAEKKAANSPNDAAALLMSQSPDMARNIHQLRQATTTAGGHTIAAVAEAKAASAALDSVAAVKLIVEATNPKTGMVNGVKLRELVSGAEKIQPHAMTEYLSKESKQSLSDLARVYEHLEAGQAGGMGKFAGAIYGVSSVGAIAAALYTGRIEAAAAGLIPFASANAIGRLFTSSKLIQAIRDGGKYSPDKWLKTKMGAQAMTAITDSLTQYNRDMERAGLSEGPKQQLRRDQLSPGMSMTPSGLPQKPMLLPVPSRKPTYEEAVGTASEVERMMRRGAFGR